MATLAVSRRAAARRTQGAAPFVAEAARALRRDARALRPVPPRPSDEDQRAMLAAHIRARDVLKSGPGEFPVGITLAMQDYQAAARRRGASATRRGRSASIRFSRPAGPTISSACRPTAACASAPTARPARAGRAGADRWATSTGPRRWRRRSATRARRAGGAGVRHRERHRHDRRRAAHRLRAPRARRRRSAACATASTCAATSTGR